MSVGVSQSVLGTLAFNFVWNCWDTMELFFPLFRLPLAPHHISRREKYTLDGIKG